MGLTPFLRNLYNGRISDEELDEIRQANLKSDMFAPYYTPKGYKKPAGIDKTVYDDRNWTDHYSNAKGDYPNCPQSNEDYDAMIASGSTDADIAAACTSSATMPQAVTDAYNQSGSKQNINDWYSTWKTTAAGQLITSGLTVAENVLLNKNGNNAGATAPVLIPSKTNPLTVVLIAAGSVIALTVILVMISKNKKVKALFVSK